jgi:phage terminase small subunit
VKTAEVQASRLLRYATVQAALKAAMEARSKRTQITADRVVTELAKLAFANMGDYWPKEGETIDPSRFDKDRTAAVEEFSTDEVVDAAGTLHRRTRLKLHDKMAALDSLARHLWLFVDRHRAEGRFEHKIMMMTSEQRLQLADQMLEGVKRYLPFLEEVRARAKSKGRQLRSGPTAEQSDRRD